ncbi:MAG: TIM barrel protein [Chloroflexota bacterium]
MQNSSQYAIGLTLAGLSSSLLHCESAQERSLDEGSQDPEEIFFKISLAQWSLHRTLFDGPMDNLDFPQVAQNTFGISAVEWVNQFFADKAEDMAYLTDMKNRCDNEGVQSLLIMIDGEGNLGATDSAERTQAVENHFKWVDAAKDLGCHSIRVNAAGSGSAEEVQQAAVDGLGQLAEYASSVQLNVLVEANCGTLPDFGNFCIEEGPDDCADMYDRYQGVRELMPFAKAVSAKSHDFNAEGQEVHTDYAQMMQIVKDAGYTGYVGIEYEGQEVSEEQGIQLTKDLLLRVGRQLANT